MNSLPTIAASLRDPEGGTPDAECSEVRSLLDDLGGLAQDRGRDGQARLTGGLQVDHEVERRGKLDGDLAGRRAFEDAIDVGGGATIQRLQVEPVAHQAAIRHPLTQVVGGWNLVLSDQRQDPLPIGKKERLATEEQCIWRRRHPGLERGLHIVRAANVPRFEHESEACSGVRASCSSLAALGFAKL